MDPDAALDTIRELTASQLGGATLAEHQITELAEACQAMDEWLSRGGFLPIAWAR